MPVPIVIHTLMHAGTLLLDMAIESPTAALFFHCNPEKLIVTCGDIIFLVDASTHSTQLLSGTPKVSYNNSHALALSDDDTMLVAGCSGMNIVYGYDTASLTLLWICNTVDDVGAVCMLGAHVLVTVYGSPTLVLDCKTGTHIAELQNTEGSINVMAVVEG
jgi:hypothetical protein